MNTARLNFTSDGRCSGWDANYPQGGADLARVTAQIKRVKKDPFIPLGRKTMPQRQANALNYFSELNTRQGYETREQALYGRGVKPRPVMREYRDKKSILEKVIGFFVEEAE